MRALAKTLYPELTRLHSCLSPCPSPCPGPLRPCPACCSFCPRAHSPFFRPRHVQFCFTHLGFGPKLGLGACSQKPICWDDRKGAPLRRLATIIGLIFAAAVQPISAGRCLGAAACRAAERLGRSYPCPRPPLRNARMATPASAARLTYIAARSTSARRPHTGLS